MTKEELKQEAEGYFKSICGDYNEEYERTGKRHYFVGFDIKNAYIASAEPREKRIAELEAQIERLKGDLELWESGACRATNLDKCGVVKELEAQIEKMKCCGNCRFSESDKLNGTFCHREGCFVVASAKCKLWDR